eukprot:c25154_g1_i2 orf=327-1490(-)
MPKDVSSRSSGSDKNRYHAYKQLSKHGKGHDGVEGEAAESSTGKRDWEDVTCPICMEYPHNAVLLLCSSHDKGCRPYMCNTSYRHSNCLDRCQKAHLGTQKTYVSREPLPESGQMLDARVGRYSIIRNTDSVRTSRRSGRTAILNGTGEAAGPQALDLEVAPVGDNDHTDESEQPGASSSSLKGDIKGLLCPLCRGKVKGWKVVQSAREHLNHKARNCAQESCLFSGNYEELRVHARREHPLARPSEVDPDRQRDWRHLERSRDLGDVLSTIHSAMPGATVMGDFVIEDDLEEEEEAGMDFPGDDGHWWTVFLLFQVFGPANSVANEGVNAPRLRSRLRVPRRGLWGESLSRSEHMEIDSSSESNESTELASRSARRQRRNRRRAEG